MKTNTRAIMTALALFVAGSASAAERTTTLAVENVSCITCGPIVKRALSQTPGVSRVDVVEEAGGATATVIFDDQQVTPEALSTVVTNAGFPAHVRD